MVEPPDWSNPATIILGIVATIITIMMVLGRIAIGFMTAGVVGGVAMAGILGFAMFKIFTEK